MQLLILSTSSPFNLLFHGAYSNFRSKVGSGSEYSYGFQGQEKDDEIKGNGNSVNYKYRMHDPRIGRFFAVDPLAPEYPHNGPYNFSENRVIDGIDLEGREWYYTADGKLLGKYGKDNSIRVVDAAYVHIVKSNFTKSKHSTADIDFMENYLPHKSTSLPNVSKETQNSIVQGIFNNELNLSEKAKKNVTVQVEQTDNLGRCNCSGDGKGIDGTGNPLIGVSSAMLTDKNNLSTILLKESFHLTDKANQDAYGLVGRDLLGHQEVLKSSFFQNSTSDFKKQFLQSAGTFIWNYKNAMLNAKDEKVKSGYQNFINNVINVYKENGIEFDFSIQMKQYKHNGGASNGTQINPGTNEIGVSIDGKKL